MVLATNKQGGGSAEFDITHVQAEGFRKAQSGLGQEGEEESVAGP